MDEINGAVTLDEPMRLRETGAKEGEKLNDFQQQLVQMATGLKGDYENEEDLHKLVDNMNVVDAVKYVGSSLEIFFDKLKNKANQKGLLDNGEDSDQEGSEEERHKKPITTASKTFAQKMFSCLICDN